MFGQLTEAQTRTLDWLDALCERARSEARGGNTALANRLGRNDATGYYFINVASLRTLTREQFARQFPAFLKEAEVLRAEAEAIEEAPRMKEAVNSLQEQLKTLQTQLTEQAKTLEALQKDGKKKKPAAKKGEKPGDEADDQEPDEDADDDKEA